MEMKQLVFYITIVEIGLAIIFFSTYFIIRLIRKNKSNTADSIEYKDGYSEDEPQGDEPEKAEYDLSRSNPIETNESKIDPLIVRRTDRLKKDLRKEEELRDLAFENFIERYTFEGRQSYNKAKIQLKEEVKMIKRDLRDKVRDELLKNSDACKGEEDEDQEQDMDRNIPDKTVGGKAGGRQIQYGCALVVDDGQFVRNMLKKILEGINFTVIGEAQNGIEAIEMAEQLKPELVLMDITIPNVDGITATEIILRKVPEIKVVICSAITNEVTKAKALKAGAKDFIKKPFDRETLIEVVERVIADNRKSIK